MKTVYAATTKRSDSARRERSPLKLLSVLLHNKVTHLYDIRINDSVKYRKGLLKALFQKVPQISYQYVRKLAPPKAILKTKTDSGCASQVYLGALGEKGLSLARELIDAAERPCFLSSELFLPGSYRDILLNEVAKDYHGKLVIEMIDQHACFKTELKDVGAYKGKIHDLS